ncbi:MAG: hypothetical protein IPN71_07350 [Fibrobacteres bacterium]|nr:hypothetical protein [Fibrobacterota bacterium]
MPKRFFFRMLFRHLSPVLVSCWWPCSIARVLHVPFVRILSYPVTLLICTGMCIVGYIDPADRPRYY